MQTMIQRIGSSYFLILLKRTTWADSTITTIGASVQSAVLLMFNTVDEQRAITAAVCPATGDTIRVSLRLAAAYELAKESQVVRGELLTTFAGIVYLIKSGPNYKIGRTTNLKQRIGNIKLQLPDPVETIHTIKTNDEVKLESYWHERFAGKRKNGEWFSLSDEDVAEFKSKSLMPVNTTLL